MTPSSTTSRWSRSSASRRVLQTLFKDVAHEYAHTATEATQVRHLIDRALREEIELSLSPRQRQIFVAIALNDVPIDVLADRMNTTRGALYKSLHAARRKLRAALAARALSPAREREEER